jgi:SAM-dependent methyltransferase
MSLWQKVVISRFEADNVLDTGASPSSAAPMASHAAYRPFPDDASRNLLQGLVEIPALVTLLRLPPGGRVLEVGCGRGNALPFLQRHCAPAALTGIDVDPALLAAAARTIARHGITADLRLGDVRRMPFADAAFDLVFDFGTCYHVAEPDRAVREIARVLAPAGRFVTESRLCQALAHPDRASRARLPWQAAPELVLTRHAGLWSLSTKRAS